MPPGGQPGHPGVTIETGDPDEVVTHRPQICSKGHDLSGAHIVRTTVTQVVDVVVRTTRVEHRVVSLRCECGELVVGPAPDVAHHKAAVSLARC
jgi:hypothetical protein